MSGDAFRYVLVPSPGFDVDRACRKLFEWLVGPGHADRTMSLFVASTDHPWRHQESTPVHSRCTIRPCAALAVAEALGHCITYQNALAEFGSQLGYAAAGEAFLGVARGPSLRFLVEAARDVSRASEDRHRREGDVGQDRPARQPGHDHDLLCLAPALVVEDIEKALVALERLIAQLRAYPDVPGLRKRPGRGRHKEE